MQTAKIKAGETYAMKRGEALVRFRVSAVITKRFARKTESQALGYVEEDRQEGTPITDHLVDPDRLLGLYTEQAELVARKEQEQAERNAKHSERQRLADMDRRMLYAFVGVAVPKVKPDEYHQMFHVGYSGTVTIRDEGAKAIIERVRALQAAS